jgi:hypothetical protein
MVVLVSRCPKMNHKPNLPVVDESKRGDAKYLKIVTSAISICANYQPRFGQGKNVSLREFQELYQADVFYAWFGLDSPLMYAAHKAAGGMTSIYRQIGIGCQYLLNEILQDSLGLSEEEAGWYYMVKASTGEEGKPIDARRPDSGGQHQGGKSENEGPEMA